MKKGHFVRIKNCVFEGDNYVGNLSHLLDCKLGRMSYVGSKCTLIKAKIGSFCSIASNVQVVAGEHPSHDWISTHPAFYSIHTSCGKTYSKENRFNEWKYADAEKQFFVVIGNDVWIGSNVLLMNGVHIGDGAIIASGAIVTKDVPPYQVFGGVPAKKISERFSEEEVSFLLSHPFWKQDEEWVKKNAASFSSYEKYRSLFNDESI